MKKDRWMISLYLFHAIYFISLGMTTFVSKFYGEIGLTDGKIGLISAMMAFVALFLQPIWGTLADRARYKRNVSAAALAVAGGLCFLVMPATSNFIWLILVLTLYNAFLLPVMPVGTAISIEYTSKHGHAYGPVRMLGTIGYQAGILATGFILTKSLRGLYPAIGIVLILSAGFALMLPSVRGYQHQQQKTPLFQLFRDRKIRLLMAVVFVASIGHQFNMAFFTKHLGDLGLDNTVTGYISMLSVILEIPFLLFGDRLMKRMSVWKWMLIGLLIGGARFALLAAVRTPGMLILAQSLSISHLACFEFVPMVYLGKTVRAELQAGSQSMLQMFSFGIARIVGSLAGGMIADSTGIPFVYGICAVLMTSSAVLFYFPLRNFTSAEHHAA